LQILEQCLHAAKAVGAPINDSIVRILRIVRLARIVRIVRVLRLIEELRTIVSSIMASIKSLAWALLLLMLVIYSFSVLFTQIVLNALEEDVPNAEGLQRWFGCVPRTALTLFGSILGGVNWDQVVDPLVEDISWPMGVMFCFYIAVCVFAFMNVITGVFVEKTTRMSQESSDRNMAHHISELFFQESANTEDITWETFKSKLDTPDMQEYLKSINVDAAEARVLFQLLDADGSGGVDRTEIVNGLLRLRGNARALELSLLMNQTSRLFQRIENQVFRASEVMTTDSYKLDCGSKGVRAELGPVVSGHPCIRR